MYAVFGSKQECILWLPYLVTVLWRLMNTRQDYPKCLLHCSAFVLPGKISLEYVSEVFVNNKRE